MKEVEKLITNPHVGGSIMFTHNLVAANQIVNFLNDIRDVNENQPYS